MAYSEAQKKAVKKYNEKTYDEIKLRVKKGQKQYIEDHSKKQGYKSLNSFIVDAINQKITNK